MGTPPFTTDLKAPSVIDDFIRFVRDTFPAADPVPLHAPRFDGNEKRYVCETIDSSYVSSVGAFVNEFEARVAAYTGAAHAIATVNGTAALHIALKLAGVAPGEYVLTQSLSFVATCNAIRYCDADPLFVDVSPDTLGLCPHALEAFLDSRCTPHPDGPRLRDDGRRIAACLPMHTLGHPVQIEALLEVCEDWNLPLVEDAAEALGSRAGGRHAGTFGRLGTLSFNGNKIITTGGGGMILTKDAALAARARHLTTTAKRPHRWAFEHDEVGYNYRLPNLNAALGCAQMESLPRFVQAKRALAGRYARWAADHGLRFIHEPPGTQANYWLNALQLSDRATLERFLTATNDAGVMTRPLWTPMHRLPMYADCPRDALAVTEHLAETLVNVPSSPLPADLEHGAAAA